MNDEIKKFCTLSDISAFKDRRIWYQKIGYSVDKFMSDYDGLIQIPYLTPHEFAVVYGYVSKDITIDKMIILYTYLMLDVKCPELDPIFVKEHKHQILKLLNQVRNNKNFISNYVISGDKYLLKTIILNDKNLKNELEMYCDAYVSFRFHNDWDIDFSFKL